MDISGIKGAGGTDPLQALSKAITKVSTDAGTKISVAEQVSKGTESSEITKRALDEAQKSSRRLEDVISVSKDGDTVQASKSGLDKLEEEKDGQFFIKPKDENTDEEDTKRSDENRSTFEEERQAKIDAIRKMRAELAIEAMAERTVEKAKAVLQGNGEEDEDETRSAGSAAAGTNSFVGVSDADLEALYLKGEISKADYDKEMKSREIEEEARNANDSSLSKEMANTGAVANQARQDKIEIEGAFSENASNTLTAAQRVGIVDAMQDFSSGNNDQANNAIKAVGGV